MLYLQYSFPLLILYGPGTRYLINIYNNKLYTTCVNNNEHIFIVYSIHTSWMSLYATVPVRCVSGDNTESYCHALDAYVLRKVRSGIVAYTVAC